MDKTHRSDKNRDRGSNFPLFERNLQTGGKNYDETVPQPSTIKAYHDREHASYVELSVAPEK
jgi:uncharacterized protein